MILLKKLKSNPTPYIQLNLFQKPVVQAASITLDPNTGEVYAMVGGNKYFLPILIELFNQSVSLDLH